MDYLDPKAQARHRIMLLVGYCLVAVAIAFGTIILLYQAYGFGIGKNGTVIQNGLLFFSSHPHPANLYINGTLENVKTNTRLSLPEGIYNVNLQRTGYRSWQRTIDLLGGTVEHIDYPFLIPTKLMTKKVQDYATAPGLMTQSPDRRWTLVQTPDSPNGFEMYDLNSKPLKAPDHIALPDSILTKAKNSESWLAVEWADDNKHVLLQHIYDGKKEYILMDRSAPDQSVNLSATLDLNDTQTLELSNKKYDQYYALDPATGELQLTTLAVPKPQSVLHHVLAYQSYGSNTILYVTGDGAPAGKVLAKLQVGSQAYTVHSLPASTTYLVDLTKYSGTLYVAVSAASENKVYIYRDPVGQLTSRPGRAPVPAQVLHVTQPNYLSFSTSTQFIVAENGTQFGVYDIENTKGYSYVTTAPLDPPTPHATWMDGDRLTYVSGGKLVMFDYDHTNLQTLMPTSSNYLPAFSPDYKFVYDLAPNATPGQFELDQTSLLIPADQ